MMFVCIARDSGGEGGVVCVFQTLKALCDLHYISSHHTHERINLLDMLKLELNH